MTKEQIKLVKMVDLNPSSHLFAGTAASWFIEESYLCAYANYTENHFVCKAVKEMEIMKPINLGDVLKFSGVCKTGKTSVTVTMTVTRKEEVVMRGVVVFVNIDANGKPAPLCFGDNPQ
ncbi:hypothetical protein EIN_254550 [Entamoeba invadens IP1]|uniref:Acyl-CoA thioesterase n=1 Tax=Entamoeba invadens IP1 TaxID=370355 RepID=A0A0A1UET1_ENTIV|nr:hypothetical protein EIN_254550 [Entamoeba invadens IP1]ELP95101.1 hypothetical protein EIN_254550 [Entamoeba invadens IP1]|eukprot:XP_004261872.1 hypothetical protein EIN_254550 [Entamoeba invadens IP1]